MQTADPYYYNDLKDRVNFVQIKGRKKKEIVLSNDQCLTLDAKIARMNALSSEDNSPPYLCRSTHWILHRRSETELEALVGRKVVCIVKYGVRPITTLTPIYKTLIESASIVSDK